MGAEFLTCLCGREFNAAVLTKCPKCRKPTNEVRLISAEQREASLAAMAAVLAEQDRLAALSEEERVRAEREAVDEYVSAALAQIESALTDGRTPALHTVVFMSSEFSISGAVGGAHPVVHEWARYGWEGWEVVATIPRTSGVQLLNSMSGSDVYGGGIGGLVVGVYLVLRLPVTARMLEGDRDTITRLLEQQYAESQTHAKPESLRLPTLRIPTPTSTAADNSGISRGMVAGVMLSTEMFDS